MKSFLLTNRREVGDSVRFDLLADGQQLMQQVIFMKAFRYLLKDMGDLDTYQYQERLQGYEDEDIVLQTGAELRSIHADRQDTIAALPQLPCERCGEATTYIGYCDIHP